jgi:glutaminyl-tRNA synthetase
LLAGDWTSAKPFVTLRKIFMSLENKETAASVPSDFIRDIVAAHVAQGKYPKIHTRFPPEPNGYLHIGHAKSICLNFGIAREFGGVCNLRMDDTNPTKEEIEYVESIQADVNWLVSGWAGDKLGLKTKGQTPETISGDGKRDFYLPPVVGGEKSAALEPFYASDYFDQIYDYAEQLIEKGRAFVRRGKPQPVPAHEGRRVPRWRTHAPGED